MPQQVASSSHNPHRKTGTLPPPPHLQKWRSFPGIVGCFGREIRWSWFTWWFHRLPGKPIYFPLKGHLCFPQVCAMGQTPKMGGEFTNPKHNGINQNGLDNQPFLKYGCGSPKKGSNMTPSYWRAIYFGNFPRFSLGCFPGFCVIWLLSFLAFGLCLLGVWAFWLLARGFLVSWLFGFWAFGFFAFWLGFLALLCSLCGFGFPHHHQ